MTSLRLESFQAQSARWPASGRHVLAQYDVREQHARLDSGGVAALETPVEYVYACTPSSKIGAEFCP